MATVFTATSEHLLGLDNEDLYLAQSTTVGLRTWTRRDRSTIGRWPQVSAPAHWADIGPTDGGSRISFAVDALVRGGLIGRISLRDIQEFTAKLGIYLHPTWVGQGYGSQALLALQRHVARHGLRWLTLDVAIDNTRAVRVYHKTGWKVIGFVQRGGYDYYEMRIEL